MFPVRPKLIASSEIEFKRRLFSNNSTALFRAKYTPADPQIKPSFVAVKQLLKNEDPEPEALIMVNMSHPNIMTCFGYIKDNAYYGLVIELCKGEDLFEYLSQRDPTDAQSKRSRETIAMDIAKGLVYLHSLSIIHADIKTENILVYEDPKTHAKITDFDSSIVLEQGQTDKVIQQRVGTRDWFAPEAAVCDENQQGFVLSVKADIYSFGIILDLLTRAMQGYPQPAFDPSKESLNPKSPYLFAQYSTPATRALIRQCMHQDPKLRPTALEIQQQFKSGHKLFSSPT